MSDKSVELAYRGLEIIKDTNDKSLIKEGYFHTAGFGSRVISIEDTPFLVTNSDYVRATNINVGRVSDINGGSIILHNYRSCFGSLDKIGKGKKTEFIFCGIPLRHKKRIKNRDDMYALYDYFINQSGWRKALLPMSGKEAVENGIIIDTTLPVTLSFGALLMYKIFYMRPEGLFKTWANLVREGCSPHIAFIQIYLYEVNCPGISGGGGSSNPLKYYIYTKRGILRYIKGNNILKTPSYYESGIYRGYGHKTSRSSNTNDTTVQSCFVTEKEVLSSMQLHRTNTPGSLAASLINVLRKGGYKLTPGNYYSVYGCTLIKKEVRKIFIEWSKEQFPSLYT